MIQKSKKSKKNSEKRIIKNSIRKVKYLGHRWAYKSSFSVKSYRVCIALVVASLKNRKFVPKIQSSKSKSKNFEKKKICLWNRIGFETTIVLTRLGFFVKSYGVCTDQLIQDKIRENLWKRRWKCQKKTLKMPSGKIE